MSLLYWYPLVKDGINQGLLQSTALSSSLNFTASGKIGGKCLTLTSNLLIANNSKFNVYTDASTELSYSLWVKIDKAYLNNLILNSLDLSTKKLIYNKILGYAGSTTSCGLSLELLTANNLTTSTTLTLVNLGGWLRNGSASLGNYQTVDLDKWIHLAITYNKNNYLTIYVNGSKIFGPTKATRAKLNNNNTGAIILLNNWYCHLSNGEQESAHLVRLKEYFNDIRIYDHALSAKEVEEIAKGLVLHYKLDDAYNESTYNYFSSGASHQNWYNIPSYSSSSSATYYTYTNVTLDGNGIYYYSAYVDNSLGEVSIRAGFDIDGDNSKRIYTENYIPPGEKGWLKGKIDLTNSTKYTAATATLRYWYRNLNNTGAVTRKNIPSTSLTKIRYSLLEKRNYQTAWTLGGTTRAASTIIYDSSGYQNNGTITGDLTCNTDTPRYNLATNFNAYDNYITVNNFSNTLKNITNGSISWWQKGSLALSLLATGNSSTGGTYFIMATNSSRNFYHQNSGTITVYKNGISGAYKITVGEWDFYCITGVNLSTWSTFRLNYYSSTYHIGSISDLRIYATILTESQIQELYNTSALIDKDGNVYPRELVEE